MFVSQTVDPFLVKEFAVMVIISIIQILSVSKLSKGLIYYMNLCCIDYSLETIVYGGNSNVGDNVIFVI